MNNALTTFDPTTQQHITTLMLQVADRIAQHDRPTSERTTNAKNFASGVSSLMDYTAERGHALPTKSVLQQWRDDMASGRVVNRFGKPYAVKSVNAKLSAVRKLLRAVADDTTDIQVKMVLRDWASVADAKETVKQDKTETDYGIRLTLASVDQLVNGIDTTTIKGLRDRALIAVMVGAGLRVGEAVKLTLREVFLTENDAGQRGIRVAKGKHNKSRVVVLKGWNSWVIEAVKAYTDALGLTVMEHADHPVFRGVKRAKGNSYTSTDRRLSLRGGQRAVEAYDADYRGEVIRVNAHDLRRTYAKISKDAGMSWDALRENMGHSSVTITENYVGHEVDWSDRVPNWSIKLKR